MASDWRETKNWVPLVITTVSLVATVLFGVATMRTKSLTVELLARTALMSQATQGLSGVSIQLDGVTVPQVYSDVIAISNSGDDPIRADDFEGPLSIGYGEDSYVRAAVAATEPNQLPVHLQTTRSRLSLSPLLLNSGDRIRIQILTTSTVPPQASGRIAGVRDIAVISRPSQQMPLKYHDWDWLAGFLLTGFGAIVYSIWAYNLCRFGRHDHLKLLRTSELLLLSIPMLWGGFALMDYGARHRALYLRLPPIVTILSIVLAIVLSMLLFWPTRPKDTVRLRGITRSWV